MNIEVGKTYLISNQVKKAVVECEFFSGENNRLLEVQTTWRYGEYKITPNNDEEVNILREAEENFCVSDFEEWEMVSTFDGISVDYYFHWNIEETEKEKFIENLEEDGYWSYLDENGWDAEPMEVWIYDGIDIKEGAAE